MFSSPNLKMVGFTHTLRLEDRDSFNQQLAIYFKYESNHVVPPPVTLTSLPFFASQPFLSFMASLHVSSPHLTNDLLIYT